MLKLYFLALFIAFAQNASAASPTILVDYDYGNQNVRSTLQISSDGSIRHVEKTCCPPHDAVISETNLSDQKMAELREWIKEASTGAIVKTTGHSTRLGSPSGTLTSTQNEAKVIDHAIKRGPLSPEAVDEVQKNQTSGARQIEDLVNTYVKNRMYE